MGLRDRITRMLRGSAAAFDPAPRTEPRTEPGVIVELESENELGLTWRTTIALDSGTRATISSDRWRAVGTRVVVTLSSFDRVIRVAADLTAIGMEERATYDLGNLEARLAELIAAGPLTDGERSLFETALAYHAGALSMDKAGRKAFDRVTRMLGGDHLPLSDDDPWAQAARRELAAIPHRDAWLELFALGGDGAKPTKKWLAAARTASQTIGETAFVETVRRWFALVAPRPANRDAQSWLAPAMTDANSEGLRNLIWACATLGDGDLIAVTIGDLAVRCLTKVKGVGALSLKGGNACIYVLSQLPGMRSVSQLSRLRARVRYRQALGLIDKAMAECADRAGVSPIDLEELALPTFGLDVSGRARTELGDHVAELAIVGDAAVLEFCHGTKRIKSVPAAVKSDHAEELAELKTAKNELAALVPTVRMRLERWMFEPRSWTLADLRARYIDHPLVAQLARRVIYATGDASMIFLDGFAIDRSGATIDPTDDAMLTMWHPLERPDVEIAEWHALLANLGVAQPFKQIDREIYVVAANDRAITDSMMFAGRTVRQHQLAALCRERGWTYELQGGFDRDSTPTKRIAAYDLVVQFAIEIAGDAQLAESNIYLDVTTGHVRFVRANQPVPLGEVPARCFSETMRDVDLFVTSAARPAA